MNATLLLVMIPCIMLCSIVGEIQPAPEETGTLEISVLCHHNLFSKEVLVHPVGEDNGIAYSIQLNPGGQYEGRFYPGEYDLTLLDGNGGQPEYATATVYGGYQSKVRFIGHAVSGHSLPETVPIVTPTIQPTIQPTPTRTPNIPIPEPTPTPVPVECYLVCEQVTTYHPEVNHTIEKCGHTIVVVDQPAWTESIWVSHVQCDDKPHKQVDYCIS